MENMKIVECKGFSKEEAFANLDFNANCPAVKGVNATQAWINAGKPTIGTSDFKVWAATQLEEKTKGVKGLGLHIVLESPVADSRKRPYNVVNVVTDGPRHWKFVYQIREDELKANVNENVTTNENNEEITEKDVTVDLVSVGKVIATCDSKSEGIAKMKELTTLNKRSYSLVAVKVPDVAPIAAYSIYTPASNTKLGSYIAFGIND